MAKIEIKNGAMARQLDVAEGTTLGELKAQIGSKFSLTDAHTAYITSGGNATAATDDTVIPEGASIDFMRNVGQKG